MRNYASMLTPECTEILAKRAEHDDNQAERRAPRSEGGQGRACAGVQGMPAGQRPDFVPPEQLNRRAVPGVRATLRDTSPAPIARRG